MVVVVTMLIFSGLVSIISFLTILPVSGSTATQKGIPTTNSLQNTANHMYLFPLVGLVVGVIVGSVAFGLFWFVDSLLVGFLVVVSIVVITGVHHLDGLADFADGLMVRSSKSKRLAAMKDVHTGSAGVAAVVLYLAGLLVCISLLAGSIDDTIHNNPWWIQNTISLLVVIVLAEIFAKFSMVVMASVSVPAVTDSSSSLFVQSMKNRKKLATSCIILLALVVPISWMFIPFTDFITSVVIASIASVCVPVILSGVAIRTLGGITGDVFGASNEITRLVFLVVFVVFI